MSGQDGGISALMGELAVIPGREQEREVLAALGRILRSAGSGIDLKIIHQFSGADDANAHSGS